MEGLSVATICSTVAAIASAVAAWKMFTLARNVYKPEAIISRVRVQCSGPEGGPPASFSSISLWPFRVASPSSSRMSTC